MRVGLALGGGVVRGYAHIGVLSVLEREGIPIHCIAGTSAGAIIGSLYAAGISASQILEGAMRLKWWHIARPVFPIRGLITFAPLERWLVQTMGGNIRFEDLKLPFAAVATDLEAGEPLTFPRGTGCAGRARQLLRAGPRRAAAPERAPALRRRDLGQPAGVGCPGAGSGLCDRREPV